MSTRPGDVAGAAPAAVPPRPGGALSGLIRGGLASVAGSAVAAVSGVLLVVAVTRALPQETAGVFFTLTSIYLIAESAVRLGTASGTVWAVSRVRALGALDLVPGLMRAALTPVVVLSVLVAAALASRADAVAELVTGTSGGAAADAVRVMAVLLPLTALAEPLLSATRGHGTVLPTVVVDRLGRSLLQFGAVAAVAATGSLTGLVAAWAAPWVVCTLVGAWWLVRLQRSAAPEERSRTGEHENEGTWQTFWSFTAPRALTSLVQLALQRLDIVLLTVLAGPAEAAVYTAATRFLVVGQFLNQALANVAEPRIGHLLTLGDRAGVRDVYQTTTGWLVLLVWPFYLLVAAGADGLLDLFGSGYDSGVRVIVVLTATMLVASAIGMVDVVLIMAGHTRWNLGNAVAALAVNVLLDVLLIPHLGLLGAALGWAAAILVKNLLALVQVWRSLGLHPFGRGTRTAVLLAVLCFGVLPGAAHLLSDGGLWVTVGTVALGTTSYVAGVLRCREVLALDGLRAARRDRARER